MDQRQRQFTKVDTAPRRWHAYTVFLFILGTLLPPLAVAARFGIGSDFFLNLLLTICGYIPGHVHNFYIQNIRNNKNHRRTPKWAMEYGLIDKTAMERRAKRAQWAGRYNDRLPRSTLENQPYEDGQDAGSSVNPPDENNGPSGAANGSNGHLWKPDDEQYYGDQQSTKTSGSGGRWHYPANFDDSAIDFNSSKKKKKKVKKDRWARTEEAYSAAAAGDESAERRKRKKSKKSKSTVGDSDTYSRRSSSTTEFPEDAEGGLYGDRRDPAGAAPTTTSDDVLFNHQL